MKWLQQQEDGRMKELLSLSESGYICKCCDTVAHYKEAGGQHPDDVECKECGALCSCKCHRPKDEGNLGR